MLEMSPAATNAANFDLPIGLSPRPRDGIAVPSLHCINDPQPEGHVANYIARRKFLTTLLGSAPPIHRAPRIAAHGPARDWLAGHVRLELRKVVAKYPFESSSQISGDSVEFRPQKLFAFELRR